MRYFTVKETIRSISPGQEIFVEFYDSDNEIMEDEIVTIASSGIEGMIGTTVFGNYKIRPVKRNESLISTTGKKSNDLLKGEMIVLTGKLLPQRLKNKLTNR